MSTIGVVTERQPRFDPRRRAQTTLAAPIAATDSAPSHDAGELVVAALHADIAGIGRAVFTAPLPSAMLLTAARQRAKEADSLRVKLLRKREMVISPWGRLPRLPESYAFAFFQAAIAAIVLAYTALENFTTERLPADIAVPHPKTKALLNRKQLEASGLDLRMSAAMSTLTGRPNLMAVDSALWDRYQEVKRRREAVGHLHADASYPTLPNPNDLPPSLWGDLLSIRSYEQEVTDVVAAVFEHYRER